MARTKNRAGREGAPAPSAPRWRLGQYIRLSKEDLNRGREDSNSVAHQKAMLDERDGGEETPILAEYRKHGNISRLTRDVLIEFVDYIQVYENNKIRIKFNFSDAAQTV